MAWKSIAAAVTLQVLVLAAALASCGSAASTTITFVNKCPFVLQLYNNLRTVNVAMGGTLKQTVSGPGLMFRHGYNPQATLAEFTVLDDGKVWYDISIVPPGCGFCFSLASCKLISGTVGFNLALDITPLANVNGANCRELKCRADGCADAYNFPVDNKNHDCPSNTPFKVTFCPTGTISSQTKTLRAAELQKIGSAEMYATSYTMANYAYTRDTAGSGVGYYSKVSYLPTCSRVNTMVNSPVGPMSEPVSMVFRGSMEIYNIAVYTRSSASATSWNRVSWYTRGVSASNMVFMNNMNIDYSGQNLRGPQCFASADGRAMASQATLFSGTLGDASHGSGYGPGVTTGVEINIMSGQKCAPYSPTATQTTGSDACRGYYDNAYSYQGWGGGQKLFVTKVKMPQWGTTPNVPSIWILNAQVMYTGQYAACNCRGMGAVGGCGELDVAEVLSTNTNRVSTHYYFYDGTKVAANGDNYASRPTDSATVYLTIIDDSGQGTIRILEMADFNFDQSTLSSTVVQNWINGKV